MSKYTTGELAKLCGVTVRTVQYYDTRGILIPSELSDGGRRLYSEDDVKRMKIICFLREQNKDYALLRKVFGSRQIDDLVAQAREAQQAKHRQRQRNYNFER